MSNSQPSPRKRAPLLVLLSAPSGAGKTTLCRNLLDKHPEFSRAVTCTTRAPREGERHGVDYHFLAPDDFQSRIGKGDFLEHATVFGNGYGTLRSEALSKLNAGRGVLLNIDVQGAETIRARAKEDAELASALVTVFLMPPSFSELESRLRNRKTESPEALARRLDTARREIACWADFQYLLVSSSMAEDLRRLEVIIEAEQMRRERSLPPSDLV